MAAPRPTTSADTLPTWPATSTATASTTCWSRAGASMACGRDSAGAAYVVFGKNTAIAAFPAVLDVSTLNGSNGFVMQRRCGERRTRREPTGPATSTATATTTSSSAASMPTRTDLPTPARATSSTAGRASGPASISRALLAANGGDGSAGFALNGYVASGNAGWIAGIGDLNGDGFADVRVGATRVDSNGLTDNGQVYVVYGKPSPPPTTKFYVVNDASTDRTYEYTATGGAVENYALNSGNTAPRGAASTAAGDKVWVVDANKKVYVYNTSGGLLGSWTAGSLAVERHGRGHRHQRHRHLDRRCQAGQGVPLHRRRQPPLGQPERRQQLQPQQQQHQPQGHRDRRHVPLGRQRLHHRQGVQVHAVGLARSGAGRSPAPAPARRASRSTRPTSATCGSSTAGPTASTSSTTPPSRTSGSQSPSTSFALAAGNTNPQGIADPPVPASGASQVATLNKTSHPSGHLAAHLGRTIPGLQASKSTGSFLPPTAGRPSVVGRQETPILISLMPSTDQDITLLAADLLRTGTKRSRSMLPRTKV